ncbi:MAG: carboxypeptidase-like regulatory domain-containing protein [Cyclobacteriaceae bacterium]
MSLIASLCVAGVSYGQSSVSVSGTLVDSETGEPLFLATVRVKDESLWTITNTVGKFDFHIPGRYRDRNMVISMMGYENHEVPIRNLIGKDSVLFKLNKATQVLDEVVFTDSLSGPDIVRIALVRIENNYPMNPFLMEGFYRDVKKLGGKYVSLLEAAVKIYDQDYDPPINKDRLRERVALMEVRKSMGYDGKWDRYFEQNNLLESLLLKNDVRYHTYPESESDFYDDFKRIKITYYNEHRVFVVERNTPNRFTRVYVDTDSYAVIRIEQEERFPNAVVKKKKRMVSKHLSEKKIVDFKEYRGKMYLNYMTVDSKILWLHEKKEDYSFETEIHQELLINHIEANTDQRIANTEKMRRYGLQFQETQYNKDFWANYNVIKDTPLNEEIVSDLEEKGKLEFQFEEQR